ncbi:MAG TPA: NUDIX hydrolase [Candidatus Saccharimonadales bacterium]|nr:NUDIX hydrolase [Candidatus Saccharimonadales bacterium]
MIKPWRILERRVLLERPPWFTVGEQDVELPDGEVLRGYNWITMRSFAIVVPLLDGGRTILARSYKLGVNAISLSLPAGYLEEGEEPLDGAKRELREETGHESSEWLPLGRYVVDGNYGSGYMHAFIAKAAAKVCEPNSGDHEEQELLVMPFGDALAKLRSGEVAQLSTAAALGLAAIALGEGR